MDNDLNDSEKRVLMALCDTDVKFNLGVVLGMQQSDHLNCIFKIVENRWGISLLGKKEIEVLDDIVLACYKIIKHSVSPEIVDFVLNYFNDAMGQEKVNFSFLEYTRKRVKK